MATFLNKVNNTDLEMAIRRDRGVTSRLSAAITSFIAASAAKSAAANLINPLFTKVFLVVSNTVMGAVVLDSTIATAEEIIRNVRIYSKKKKEARRQIAKLNGDVYNFCDVENKERAINDLSKFSTSKISFRDKHGILLKQLYYDFDKDTNFDALREVMEKAGFTKAKIDAVKENSVKNGKVKLSTLNAVCPKNSKTAKILDTALCNNFVVRIADNYKGTSNKFNSISNLTGALNLTAEQQRSKVLILTEEQKFINKLAKVSGFKNKLIKINELNKKAYTNRNTGNYANADSFEAEATKIKAEIMNKTALRFQEMPSIKDMDSGGKIRRMVRREAKKTVEKTQASWTRHTLPITKQFGKLIGGSIFNAIADTATYRGKLKGHKLIKGRNGFEQKYKTLAADVICEPAKGFTFLKMAYQRKGYADIIEKTGVNPSFVNMFALDEKKVKNTKEKVLEAINKVSDTALARDDKDFAKVMYMDNPVLIKINANNYSAKSSLPIATFNVDQEDVFKAILDGIAIDIKEKNINIDEINNIEFSSGSNIRHIYKEQIKETVESITDSSKRNRFESAFKALKSEEYFKRVFDTEAYKKKDVLPFVVKKRIWITQVIKDGFTGKRILPVSQPKPVATNSAVATTTIKPNIREIIENNIQNIEDKKIDIGKLINQLVNNINKTIDAGIKLTVAVKGELNFEHIVGKEIAKTADTMTAACDFIKKHNQTVFNYNELESKGDLEEAEQIAKALKTENLKYSKANKNFIVQKAKKESGSKTL